MVSVLHVDQPTARAYHAKIPRRQHEQKSTPAPVPPPPDIVRDSQTSPLAALACAGFPEALIAALRDTGVQQLTHF